MCVCVTSSILCGAQDVPKLGKVVHASAASISESEVQMDNGSSVPFDYLVLASGSTWADPVCSGTDAALSDRKVHQQASTLATTGNYTVCVASKQAADKSAIRRLCRSHRRYQSTHQVYTYTYT